MIIARAFILVTFLLAAGCVSSGKPKTVLIDGLITPQNSSIVHPIAVPGGLMMIRAVDDRSTHILSIGYLGSVYVPPGEHEFEVEVSHGFGVQDAGGPAWTAPPNEKSATLESVDSGSILVTKGVSKPKANLEAGKSYEVRFGFDRSNPEKPVPVTWISPIPSL